MEKIGSIFAALKGKQETYIEGEVSITPLDDGSFLIATHDPDKLDDLKQSISKTHPDVRVSFRLVEART